MKLEHLLQNSRIGEEVRFDPTLAVHVVGSEVFEGPKRVQQVKEMGKIRLLESSSELYFWRLEGEDGGRFMLIEDGPAELLFLLRLVAEAPHQGEEPDFLSLAEYSINTGTSETVYGHYSDPLLAEAWNSKAGRNDQVLLRVFVRRIDETSEEFLWIWLANDRQLSYFVGVIIDPAQILPA
ncbi:MAG: hypothetical protein PHE55_23390 [Methylococcaceae bacterium]|nr:hypothetical protein [Methylococcaceae bacterium]